LRTLIDDDSQPSVVSTIEGCFAFPPPNAARHLLLTPSGSGFLTNFAASIDFFDLSKTVVRNKLINLQRRLVT
jgi:hypothetical protein